MPAVIDVFSRRVVGRRKGAELIYAGKVDHGFDAEIAKALASHNAGSKLDYSLALSAV